MVCQFETWLEVLRSVFVVTLFKQFSQSLVCPIDRSCDSRRGDTAPAVYDVYPLVSVHSLTYLRRGKEPSASWGLYLVIRADETTNSFKLRVLAIS